MGPLRAPFAAAFGREPDLDASAPGRVNLLGEHTDYNGGFVLPTAIPQRTHVSLARRADSRVEVATLTLGDRGAYILGGEHQTGGWIDYVQGVTQSLHHHGRRIGGFDALLSSDVPVGRGLSSSAALEVALLRGLKELFGLHLGDLDLALVARWGENHVAGAPVGILDPMACHLADEGTALFLDTRSLDYERLPLPGAAELVVVDSGVIHAHSNGGYRARREECERAARSLGVRELRDLGPGEKSRIDALEPPLNRRVRHVVTENARVVDAASALRAGDAAALGRLFLASHASMRDDFEISVPEVDAIVERARSMPDVYGARLTGGGFGGAVVCLVKQGSARKVAAALSVNGAHPLIPQPESRS